MENVKICSICLVLSNGQYIFKPNYGEEEWLDMDQAKYNPTIKHTSLKLICHFYSHHNKSKKY